jgi:hypothetical protein
MRLTAGFLAGFIVGFVLAAYGTPEAVADRANARRYKARPIFDPRTRLRNGR